MISISNILAAVDHTALSVTATSADVIRLCEEAKTCHTASVCVAPCFVRLAAEQLQGEVAVCTVIGFPNGYQETAIKCEETRIAIESGADEIDMVINLGWVKEERYDDILAEIRAIKQVCGNHILKVIIETCLLTDDEKIRLCDVVSRSGADFIKTSTGFSSGGATLHDIDLFVKHIHNGLRIKAAGGIRSIDDARAFMEHGAHRLGTSAIVRAVLAGES